MERRVQRELMWIDWVVMGLYGAIMIGIGWYFSRRNRTTDDYLLGGRQMSSWSVGLSLFAALLSTISYLAWPGEMIKYGPAFSAQFIAYPFIWIAVGWLIIPSIMRLRVTSAYEILETRLGLSVRMVGSMLFLSMRILWMAVIVYATAGKILVPLLGLDPSSTPYVCAVMGLVTLIYTSMGGLKAVVAIDVMHTSVLFLGAILTAALVTIYMGGAGTGGPPTGPPTGPR